MAIRSEIKNIFWDFDGVLLDSNAIRDYGFCEVLKEFPKQQVDKLLAFHRENGGWSRYIKFRFFFEEIRNEKISDSEVQSWADKFSNAVLFRLKNHNLLINDSLNFVKSNFEKYNMHIVSGSDGIELNYLCEYFKIDKFFKTIQGSPTPKKELVKIVMEGHKYDATKTVLVGDSKNDWEAAIENKIEFIGYNNIEFQKLQMNYISSFEKM